MNRLLVVLAFLMTIQSQASTEQINHFKTKLEEERKALLETELRKRGIMGTLYELNKNLSKLEQDIKSLEGQLDSAQKTVESHAKTTSQLKATRERQKVFLRERLRALYKMGFKGYTEVLLSSQSGGEFVRNLKYLEIITKKDAELITNYKVTIVKLDHEEKTLRSQVKVYLKIQGDLKSEKNKFATEKLRQDLLLSDLEKNRETHLMAINEWRSAAKQLEEKIVDMDEKRQINQELSRGTLLEHKGGLHAPVSREIAQKHGVIKNARFGTEILHKGLFFAARPGDKVAALFWGKVAYAGWINGYGDTVIIDHGNHYYSLYAHNSKISKKVGDSVAQGEIVAESGESGSLRGPGLYFEIRHFSESLDPLPWLDLRHSKRL